MADIKVTLLDHMGSDLTVVNAARVSFDKASEWVSDGVFAGTTYELIGTLSDRDTKLISYLATHNHWSPFAHPQASFRVAAPLFVARQLQKHTVGLAWNEVSRRYVDSEPSFYTPDRWRKRAENAKQGSSDDAISDMLMAWGDGTVTPEDITSIYTSSYDGAFVVYQAMLKAGVCPEQARMVLPQSMMTEWIWTGSLYAFARVCNLRLDSHTQAETRIVAEYIANAMDQKFPVSWKALVCTSS